MKFPRSIYILIVIVALVIGGAVGLWWATAHQTPAQSTTSVNSTNTNNESVQITSLKDEVASLQAQLDSLKNVKTYIYDNDISSTKKIFSNKDIGISFTYPAKLGSIELTMRPGETGSIYSATFSTTKDITFGGIDTKFSEGREGSFIDTQGYQLSNGKYYFKFVTAKPIVDPTYLLEPLEVINVKDQKILLLDQNSFVSSRGVTDGPALQIGANSYGALVNLKGSTFPGFAFWDRESKTLKLNELKELIQSIKFL